MATMISSPSPACAGRTGSAAGPLATLAGNLLRRWRERRAVRHMMALDAHMLQDIGLGRGEIEFVARYGRAPF